MQITTEPEVNAIVLVGILFKLLLVNVGTAENEFKNKSELLLAGRTSTIFLITTITL
jgi:hypothetical protein